MLLIEHDDRRPALINYLNIDTFTYLRLEVNVLKFAIGDRRIIRVQSWAKNGPW